MAGLGPWGYAATGLLLVGFLFFLYYMGKKRERARWEKAVYKKDMEQADAIMDLSKKHSEEREVMREKVRKRLARGDIRGALADSGLSVVRPKSKGE